MSQITSLSDIYAAIKDAHKVAWGRSWTAGSAFNQSSFAFVSGNAYPGGSGSAFLTPTGSLPATAPGTVYNGASTGALPLPSLGAGEDLHLLGVELGPHTPPSVTFAGGFYQVVDLLVGFQGDPTIGTVQTINSSALPRYTTGENVELFCFNGGSWSSAATFPITVDYVNQSGVSKSTSFDFLVTQTGSVLIGSRVQAVPFASGDYGIRQVTSIQCTGTPVDSGALLYFFLARVVYGVRLDPLIGRPSNYLAGRGILPTLDYGSGSSPCLTILHKPTGTLGYANNITADFIFGVL